MANLVIQTAFLGDTLLAIPLIRKIRSTHPNQPLVLFCRKGFGDIFIRLGLVDEVLEVDKKDKGALNELVGLMRTRNWHHIYCPHYSFRSYMILRSLKARRKFAFRTWWNSFLFSDTLKRPLNLPDALRQMSLLTAENSEFKDEFQKLSLSSEITNSGSLDKIDFRPTPQIPDWAQISCRTEILRAELPGKLSSFDFSKSVVLAPGSVWNTKKWSGFLDLAQLLKKSGHPIVLIGSPAEKDLCAQIVEALGVSQTGTSVLSFAGDLSLYESLQVLASARLLVSNDSGAMHMATLAGAPVVSVFGPTVLSLGFRPWSNQAKVVQKKLSCRPCGKHGHHECPIGTHECMTQIKADEVYSEVSEFLK